MKRIITAILALALLLTLAGCQCKHEWTQADCLTPKTCAKCGETEGAPLGHVWKDATCQAPKTCGRCGLTEGETIDHSWEAATCEAPETCKTCGAARGEALGHSWKEANYQDPETCATCGATQGEPLEASFEKHGLKINLWENKQLSTHENGQTQTSLTDPEAGFPYVTTCHWNHGKKATGALYLSNYRIFPSDETHPAVEGYEWRAFDVEIVFSDENAQRCGMIFKECFENYYAIEDWDSSSSELTGTAWEAMLGELNVYSSGCFAASYHGETFPVAIIVEGDGYGGWHARENDEDGTTTDVNIWSISYYVCVPTGYDGVVIGFIDGGTEWKDGMYIYDVADENTLFFRLGDPQT